MLRADLVQQITQSLTILSSEVSLRNSLNLTDLNLHAEDFYCSLLNLAFGYRLQNINAIHPNSASIDLGGRG